MGPKNSNRVGNRKVTKRKENNWTGDFQNAIHELDSLHQGNQGSSSR